MTQARSRRTGWALLLVAIGLVGMGSWLFGELGVIDPESNAVEPLLASVVPEARAEAPQAAPAADGAVPAMRVESREVRVESPEVSVESTEVRVESPVVSAPEAEPSEPHPHPITPRHLALQRELQLIAALNDALDLRDAESMRKLLADYRAHDPRDDNHMQAGYARLIECLEAPGDASRAAAQAYYDTFRASTLRRFIRRICLE